MAFDFLSKPFYDDYDESKDFARLLFRPDKAVQARELTQLQTLIQKQLERLGKFVIEEGSVVTGGQTTIDTISTAIGIVEYSGNSVSDLIGQTISGGQAKCRVVAALDPINDYGLVVDASTVILKNLTGIDVTSDYSTKIEIIVSGTEYDELEDLPTKIHQSGSITGDVISSTENDEGNLSIILANATYDNLFWNTDSNIVDGFNQIFVAKENILQINRIFDCSNGELLIFGDTPSSPATTVSVDDGVYFTRGIFNHVNKQTIPVSIDSNAISARIGLVIEETIVGEGDDASLNDPSQGYPNYAAPGAHRYKIHLKLAKKEYEPEINTSSLVSANVVISNTADSDFIELIRLESGVIKKKNQYPILAEIEKTLARRTYEESGNYTVRHFPVRFDEIEEDPSTFAVSIEPGKAYVFGREFETISVDEIIIDKARSVDSVYENNISTYYGGYFETSEVFFQNGDGTTTIDYSNLPEVVLKNSSTIVGKANIRLISRNQSKYRIYLFNTRIVSGQRLVDTDKILYNDIQIATVDGKFKEGSAQSLIFKLPESAVSTLRPRGVGAGFEIVKKSVISSALTFSDAGGASASYTSLDVSDYLIFQGSGDVIPTTGYTVIRNGSFGITVVVDASYDGLGPFTIYSPQTISNVSERRKTLVSYDVVNENLSSSGPDTPDLQFQDFELNTWYGLGVSDVDKIKVTYTDEDSEVVDITSYFEFDSGQRDTHYDWGKIRRTGTPEGLADTTLLTMTVSFFNHVGNGYLSVDSYSMTYQNIPTYKSASGSYDLRDCIDFRPYRLARSVNPVLMSLEISSQDYTDAQNYTSYGFLSSLNTIPSYGGVANFDFSYYLPRIDIVSLTADLEFKHTVGIPSKNPKAPSRKENEMPLYILTIPAYTFNLDDILVQYIDNKRYTMRDIGDLEKRVDKLEYYTTLSLLEKDAENIVVLNDSQDSERYKTGILVDSFIGHNIGDVTNEDYNCSVDILNRQLRPPFNTNAVKLDYYGTDDDGISEESVGVRRTGNLVTLDYTPHTYIDQPLATGTTSINPFDYTSFIGRTTLNPPCDPWMDQQTRPEVIINKHGENDAIEFGKKFKNTVWEEWSLRGFGVSSQNKITRNQLSLSNSNNALTKSEQSLYASSISDLSDDGFNLAYRDNFQLLGSDIIPIDVRPYIRSQLVNFTTYGLTPNTTVYFYFDGRKININGNSNTDSSGAISGNFTIPEKTFRSGMKQLKITDAPSWGNINQATCVADVYYMAQGLSVQMQESVTSTEVPQYARKAIQDSTVNFDITEKVFNNYINPLSQTFSVSSTDHPEGLFLESVDLNFATKPTVGDLPVYIEIRPTVGGYPHSTMYLPFSQVAKKKEEILVGLNNKTSFKFKSPVYVEGGEEYAIVIHTNDKEYTLYTAKLGDNQLDSQILVTKQPYSGNLFKPQNSSAWKPDINEDLKFSVNRCKFTETTGTALFRNVSPTSYLYGNILHIGTSNLELNNTELSFSVKKKTAVEEVNTPNSLDSLYKSVPSREDVTFPETIQIETTSDPSILLRGEMGTTRDDISPVINVAFLNVVLVEVEINQLDADNITELLPSSGDAVAKYITRNITLGEASRDVLVDLDAVKPVGCNIRLFYKSSSSSGEGLNLEPYEEMVQSGNVGVFSSKVGDYKSYQFKTTRTVTDDNFTVFSVKIVMESSTPTVFPVIKNLKILALDATSDE